MLLYTEEFTYTSGRNQSAKQIGLKWFFKCDHCGKEFSRKGNKGRHDRPNHFCTHKCSCEYGKTKTNIRCIEEGCEEYISNAQIVFIKSGRTINDTSRCKKHHKQHHRKIKNKKDRLKMYELLGNKCICCGEKDNIYFHIDHVNNDGKDGHSVILKEYLESPDRFQLLCANCNHAKMMNGGVLYRPEKFTRRKLR